MHALAVIPPAPSRAVRPPRAELSSSFSKSEPAYSPASPEKALNIITSRLNQDRFHIFKARYAWIGRPRCIVEAPSANPPTVSETNEEIVNRADAPSN